MLIPIPQYGIAIVTSLVEILKKNIIKVWKLALTLPAANLTDLSLDIYMCAQHITFHSNVDSGSSDMNLKSTKNHPNLHERPTYTTKSYAPSLECGPLQKQLQVLYPPIQVSYR